MATDNNKSLVLVFYSENSRTTFLFSEGSISRPTEMWLHAGTCSVIAACRSAPRCEAMVTSQRLLLHFKSQGQTSECRCDSSRLHHQNKLTDCKHIAAEGKDSWQVCLQSSTMWHDVTAAAPTCSMLSTLIVSSWTLWSSRPSLIRISDNSVYRPNVDERLKWQITVGKLC